MPVFNNTKPPQGSVNVPYALTQDAASNNTSPDTVDGLNLDSDKVDSNWFRPNIEPLNWNKNFPYQLTVVKIDSTGFIFDNSWSYTLPVPPESLSVGAPFASNLTVTQGGVVEQHNGIPLRHISINGTTGILPLRGNSMGSGALAAINRTGGIFAGTINTATNFRNISNSLGFTKLNNTVTDSEISTDVVGRGSGYYQFHVLAQFLERYAALKKTVQGKNYVLALMMWKDQHYYLVKPDSFNLSRNSGSPFEYKYSITFTAWRRIKYQGSTPNSYNYVPATNDASVLGKVLQTIKATRDSVALAGDTIRALGIDVDNGVIEPLRQSILLGNDLLGIPQSLAEMPAEIIRGAAGAVLLYAATANNYEQFNKPGPDGVGAYSKEWEDMISTAKAAAELGQNLLAPNFQSGQSSNALIWSLTQKLTALPQQYINSAAASAVQQIFISPNDNLGFFSSIPVGSLRMPKEWQSQVKQQSALVKQNSTRIYWETQVQKLQNTLNIYEMSIGAGDPVMAATYGIPYVEPVRSPAPEDFDIVFNLNNAISAMSQLAVSDSVNTLQLNPTQFIAGLATKSGIAFTQPQAKFLVPFPYGFSLENLAAQYLGDPNRWIEIAALNGLQSPYVDEEGFSLRLLSNASDNQVIVSDASNLFIGQSVSIISNTLNSTSCIIQNIKSINSSYFIITLSAPNSLISYLLSDQATLHAFLPGTVNSQMSIYIPSQESPQYDDFIYKPIPNVDNFNQIFQIANIDLLLNSDNDIILTNDGDSPLAVGLNAITQDLKLKVSTVRGTILQHLTFGLPIDVGYSLADVSASDILRALVDTFKGDTTYTNVSFANINVTGPTSQISFTVGLSGLASTIPITIDLN